MNKLIVFALACIITPSALAASPWDGTWKLDRSKSHLTGDSFTYSKTPDGKWLVTAGEVKIPFAPDGKPYPVIDADHTMTTTAQGDHTLTFVNQFKGKTTSTMKETLSTDGQTLTDETSGTHVDGTSYTSSEVSKRSGPGKDFFAKWISTKENSSTPGIFTISTAADGTMTWNYTASKETLVIKLDGKPAPVTGPEATQGVTVAYKKAGLRRNDFIVEIKGKKIAEGYDEIAVDGKSFAETQWAPGKMDEKTTAVYVKQ